MGRRSGVIAILNAMERSSRRAQKEADMQRRRVARQHAMAERQAARERIYEEKERKRQYIEDRIQEVSDQNSELSEQVSELASVLHDGPSELVLSFDSLKPKGSRPVFEAPAVIATAAEPPDREKFLATVPKPSWIVKLLFRKNSEQKHQEDLAGAESKYQNALTRHAAAEQDRISKLDQLRKEYEKALASFQRKQEDEIRKIEDFKKAYFAGDREGVEEYNSIVLQRSDYPEGFPEEWRLAYVPDSKQLVIEYELPGISVVPDVLEYRYVKSKDMIDAKPRKASEIKDIYQDVLLSVTLRVLNEVFRADQGKHIEMAVFNGYLRTTDPATGKKIQPFVISIRTTREKFLDIDLNHVDKAACLRNLGAQVSPRPSELQAVKPIVEFNMLDKRFIDQQDLLGTLDTRPNLMELNPYEFENLVSNLFEKMGLESRLTRSSKDGGVDAIAFDKRPVIGGKVVIQAKRYKNAVGVSAVRDLYGTMMNEGANKGILVTTSNYGTDAYEFAKDKPIELIDGGGLLYLLTNVGVEAKIIFPEDD